MSKTLVAVMGVVCSVGLLSGCDLEPRPQIKTDWKQPVDPDYERRELAAAASHPVMEKVHALVVERARGAGDDVACFYPDVDSRMLCTDTSEFVLTPWSAKVELDSKSDLGLDLMGLTSEPYNGLSVYQPKDAGRIFFSVRGLNQAPYWVLYDPEARDVGGYLTKSGFKNVQVVSSRVAIADPIQDKQKRRDFWIWVQARERRMKAFEAKYPHLAATVAPKE